MKEDISGAIIKDIVRYFESEDEVEYENLKNFLQTRNKHAENEIQAALTVLLKKKLIQAIPIKKNDHVIRNKILSILFDIFALVFLILSNIVFYFQNIYPFIILKTIFGIIFVFFIPGSLCLKLLPISELKKTSVISISFTIGFSLTIVGIMGFILNILEIALLLFTILPIVNAIMIFLILGNFVKDIFAIQKILRRINYNFKFNYKKIHIKWLFLILSLFFLTSAAIFLIFDQIYITNTVPAISINDEPVYLNFYKSYTTTLSQNEILSLEFEANSSCEIYIFTHENFIIWEELDVKSQESSKDLSMISYVSVNQTNFTIAPYRTTNYENYKIIIVNRDLSNPLNSTLYFNLNGNISQGVMIYGGFFAILEWLLLFGSISNCIIFLFIHFKNLRTGLMKNKYVLSLKQNEVREIIESEHFRIDFYPENVKSKIISRFFFMIKSESFLLIFLSIIALLFAIIPFFFIWPYQIFGDVNQYFMNYSNFELYSLIILPSSVYYSISRTFLIFTGLPSLYVAKYMRTFLVIFEISIFYSLCKQYSNRSFLIFLAGFIFFFNIYNIICLTHLHKQLLAQTFFICFLFLMTLYLNRIDKLSRLRKYLLMSLIVLFFVVSMLTSEFFIFFSFFLSPFMVFALRNRKVGLKELFKPPLIIFPFLAILILILAGSFGLILFYPSLLNQAIDFILSLGASNLSFYSFLIESYSKALFQSLISLVLTVIASIFFISIAFLENKKKQNSFFQGSPLNSSSLRFVKYSIYFVLFLFFINLLFIIRPNYTTPFIVFNIMLIFIIEFLFNLFLKKTSISGKVLIIIVSFFVMSILSSNFIFYSLTSLTIYSQRFEHSLYPLIILLFLMAIDEIFLVWDQGALKNYGGVIKICSSFREKYGIRTSSKTTLQISLILFTVFIFILVNTYLIDTHLISTYIYSQNPLYQWITEVIPYPQHL